jgi:integrase
MAGMRPLDGDELAAVARCFEGRFAERNRALFGVLYYFGWRISEALALRVRDVFGPGGEPLRYVRLARRFVKKRTESRTEEVHEGLRPWLVAWYGELAGRLAGLVPGDVPLFCGDGLRAVGRKHAWEVLVQAYERAGIGRLGVGCHGLRKTHGQQVYEWALGQVAEGKPVDPNRLAQLALHHRQMASTQHYLQIDGAALPEARKAMPNLSSEERLSGPDSLSKHPKVPPNKPCR